MYHLETDLNRPSMRHLINEDTGAAIGTIEKMSVDYSVPCYVAKKTIRFNDEEKATDFIVRLHESLANRKKNMQLKMKF